MKKHAKIASVVVLLAAVMLNTSALAQDYTSGAPVFPEGWYVSDPYPFAFTFESTELTDIGIASVSLYDLVHTPGSLTSTPVYNTGGNYWVETFNSTLTGTATITPVGGGTPSVGYLTTENTPVTVDIFGNYSPGATGSAANGSWSTSMTVMDWPAEISIPGGNSYSFWIQCVNAPGVTTVTYLTEPQGTVPAGWYEATSYFDVQPQISLDNDPDDPNEWITADQSGDMTLIPEPSSLALLGIGAVSLLAREWRRRTAKA